MPIEKNIVGATTPKIKSPFVIIKSKSELDLKSGREIRHNLADKCQTWRGVRPSHVTPRARAFEIWGGDRIRPTMIDHCDDFSLWRLNFPGEFDSKDDVESNTEPATTKSSDSR